MLHLVVNVVCILVCVCVRASLRACVRACVRVRVHACVSFIHNCMLFATTNAKFIHHIDMCTLTISSLYHTFLVCRYEWVHAQLLSH